MVAGVLGNSTLTPVQTGEDLCTGDLMLLLNVAIYITRYWCFMLVHICFRCLIKQDENGVNRPVCSYVRVLRAGRLLESPRQAARFVSLLAQERAPMVGGGVRQEQWCSIMAFLCRNKVKHPIKC